MLYGSESLGLVICWQLNEHTDNDNHNQRGEFMSHSSDVSHIAMSTA